MMQGSRDADGGPNDRQSRFGVTVRANLASTSLTVHAGVKRRRRKLTNGCHQVDMCELTMSLHSPRGKAMQVEFYSRGDARVVRGPMDCELPPYLGLPNPRARAVCISNPHGRNA